MRVAPSVCFGITGPAGDLAARARVQVRVGSGQGVSGGRARARGHPRARAASRVSESRVHVGHIHAARAAHVGAHRIQSAAHVSHRGVALENTGGEKG